MAVNNNSSSDAAKLIASLKKKAALSEKHLRQHHPQAVALLESAGVKPGKIREHAAKIATAGALTGTLLLGSPAASRVPLLAEAHYAMSTTSQLQNMLTQQLADVLPKEVVNLMPEQEIKIKQILKNIWGLDANAELEGERLNRSYGLIGLEQHLPRFPGDTIYNHDLFQDAGITPGLGAWGYFSLSSQEMTKEISQKEKYYVAVQTLYLPDWEKRLTYLREWYKYRKVVVVNPLNGKTILCDIADSGPADWTDKHFGGSPEVMDYLELTTGKQKGPVVLFFVDDPEDKIPLGPLENRVW